MGSDDIALEVVLVRIRCVVRCQGVCSLKDFSMVARTWQ
jgi:hypothetical protein